MPMMTGLQLERVQVLVYAAAIAAGCALGTSPSTSAMRIPEAVMP